MTSVSSEGRGGGEEEEEVYMTPGCKAERQESIKSVDSESPKRRDEIVRDSHGFPIRTAYVEMYRQYKGVYGAEEGKAPRVAAATATISKQASIDDCPLCVECAAVVTKRALPYLQAESRFDSWKKNLQSLEDTLLQNSPEDKSSEKLEDVQRYIKV